MGICKGCGKVYSAIYMENGVCKDCNPEPFKKQDAINAMKLENIPLQKNDYRMIKIVVNVFLFGILLSLYIYGWLNTFFFFMLVGFLWLYNGLIYFDDTPVATHKDAFIEKNNITITKSVEVGSREFIFDENSKNIYVLNRFKFGDLYNIPFKSMLTCEMLLDNEVTEKTSRTSQVLGMAVGGALLGGVGAVIGGVTGNKTSTNKLKNCGIRLIIDSISNPILEFMFEGSEVKKVTELYGVFKVIIQRNADKD